MEAVRIITPVKDSIELTLRAIEAVSASELSLPYVYTVYNDFCTPENSRKLQEASLRFGFTLVNLADITVNPSPNYLLILRR
ncbi:MAG: glycosyltransferase family 2 protein, partial [Tannerellaceae bacterium]|nr:glycosyltransferase family 2 protein [Tannerellaceae bacterium]